MAFRMVTWSLVFLFAVAGGALGCGNSPQTAQPTPPVESPTTPSVAAITPAPTETPSPVARPTAKFEATPAFVPTETPGPSASPTPAPTLPPRTGICEVLCDREYWQGQPDEASILANIERGEDPTAKGTAGLTPLHWAAGYSTPPIVEMLLSFGGEINARDEAGKTPLFLVGLNGDPEVARALLSNGADISVLDNQGWTPLHTVVRTAPREVISVLLEHGADLTAATATGQTPLHQAAAFNNTEGTRVVTFLLDNGAEVDARSFNGTTPLHWAARNNPKRGTLAILLAYDAALDATNVDGWTALHYAASSNTSEKVLEFLWGQGLQVDHRTPEGVTPLHIAAGLNSSPAIVRFLVKRGADINDPDVAGWTSLHFAAGLGQNVAVVEALLEMEADLWAVSTQWETPCQVAKAASPPPEATSLFCPVAVAGQPSSSTDLLAAYQYWAEWLYAERDPTSTWSDGSNLTDGVSHLLPELPIPAGAYEEDHMTCAQVELLELAAIPEGEGIDTWYLKPNWMSITKQWDRNYAKLVWGDHPDALVWSKRVTFTGWCGEAMR